MKHRAPALQRQIEELREKIALFESAGLKASATEARRTLFALVRGYEPEAPRIDRSDKRPRQRVVWVKPGPVHAQRYFVKLSCGHTATVAGRGDPIHAPRTAVCRVCTPANR